MSPANYFSLEAGYIPTDSNFLTGKLPKQLDDNIFFKTGFNDFKAVESDKDGKITAFREPVSAETDRLILAFFEAFKLYLYDNKNSFDDVLTIIKNVLSIN